MPADLLLILAVAGSAAVASPLGGLLALWRRPTTLFMSLALGFASGVLLATISFEMLPAALELSSLAIAVAGFIAGFAAVYGFDLAALRPYADRCGPTVAELAVPYEGVPEENRSPAFVKA